MRALGLHQHGCVARRPAVGRRVGTRTVCAAAPAVAKNGTTDAYRRIKGIKVCRSSDGQLVDITTLWGQSEKAVVAFARSFGCPFCWELAIQLRRDVKPRLDEMGIKLFLVSIGTHERSKDFVEVTGFPADCLFADPDNALYDSLGLVRDLRATFFSIDTPLALLRRVAQARTDDLGQVLQHWQPWNTPKSGQFMQQGGMFVFDGERTILTHYDQATSAHIDLAALLGVAAQLATAQPGGCGEEGVACELPQTQ